MYVPLPEAEFKRRYPSADYEAELRLAAELNAIWASQTQEQISAGLVAQADEDRARGWSTE